MPSVGPHFPLQVRLVCTSCATTCTRPEWVHACGDRLTAADLEQLREWSPQRPPPGWVEQLTQRLQHTVPHYRRRPVTGFAEVRPVDRAALASRIADFVPDDADLNRLFQGTSSGSTGSALVIPLHPVSTATELMLLRYLLAQQGVAWTLDPERLGLLAVVDQHHAYTYASVMSALGDAAMARVNLHPSAWRTSVTARRFCRPLRRRSSPGPLPPCSPSPGCRWSWLRSRWSPGQCT